MSYVCNCGKKYASHPGLSRHGKKCDEYQEKKANKERLGIRINGNNNIGSVGNNSNAINGNNNTINNQHIHIHIHGQQDDSHITDTIMAKITNLINIKRAPLLYVKHSLQNIKNRNIKITDPSRNLCWTWDGEKWQKSVTKTKLSNLMERGSLCIESWVNDKKIWVDRTNLNPDHIKKLIPELKDYITCLPPANTS